MHRCAFLTLDDPADYVIDDELVDAPLHALGWTVEAVPWRTPGAAWHRFDAIVIRSPWDYQDDPDAFLDVLEQIERSGAPLFNPLDLVRWNLRKTYLRDLAARGIPVVPTIWRDRLSAGDLVSLFAEIGTDEAVVKPVVSANADGAFRLTRQSAAHRALEIEAYYADRPLMAQPFVQAVTDEGEFSLFYFNGEYSHAVLKTPKADDFRVQEEHGGLIQPIDPGHVLRMLGEDVLDALGSRPLYARVDFVRQNRREAFWLMELELIEPALYFRMDPDAPARFARALDDRVTARRDHAA
jgi:glutathione synthase/RimK-type ligase-like ATP-grasp enzyme